MRKRSTFLLIFLIFTSSSLNTSGQIEVYDTKRNGDNFNEFFIEIFKQSIKGGGLVSRIGSQTGNLYEGINQGLALVTAIKLYDIYQSQYYLNIAVDISDFVATFLLDPRFELISSFYDADADFLSNYRNMEDNLLLIWGLTELADRLDPSRTILIEKQNARVDYLVKDLSMFIDTEYFNPSLRIDNPSSSPIFNGYHNLFSAFIITQLHEQFAGLMPSVIKVFDFVNANLTNFEGGVHTIYTQGFHDEIVSLKNTGLYALLALNLYEIYDEEKYYTAGEKSIKYIETYNLDIGLTGGYFETLVDDKPIQVSKSLSSHAILLLAFLKMAKYNGEEYGINLLSLWQTIMEYFVKDEGDTSVFYSTIARDGSSGSVQINTFDNLLMLYALSEMPLLIKSEFNKKVQFSEKMEMSIDFTSPIGVDFNISVFLGNSTQIYLPDNNNKLLLFTEKYSGTSGIENVLLSFTPPRPNSGEEKIYFKIIIESEELVTDTIIGDFSVIKETGIILSTQTVTLFSVLLIIVFVYFLRGIDTKKISPST